MRTGAMIAAALLAAAAVGCGDDDERVGGGGGSGGTGGTGGGGEVDFRIPGLSAPAQVHFDEQGVLHATCATDEDCAAVLGYFHAQNRFWQMDLFRRVARGRASTLLGMLYGADEDARMRQFLSTTDGTPIEEAIWPGLDEATRSIVEAYAVGVNGWLADLRAGRNGARLTEEYALPLVHGTPETIPDWEALDTVAFARLMTLQLSESSGVELRYGPAFSRLDPERAVALFTLAPASRTNTMGASGVEYRPSTGERAMAPVDREAIRQLQARLDEARNALELAAEAQRQGLFGSFSAPDEPAGSNNWVLSPSRTAAGKALLANDPHLSLSNPPVWYFASLDAKSRGNGTFHVAGGTFPGVPGVPIGRNENVAWGCTVAYYDVTDVYVETLDEAGTHVLFDPAGGANPQPVAIVTREVEIEVAGSQPVTRTLKWVPHHGPIVSEDPANRTAITVKWTGHEPTYELKAFLDLARSSTLEEARDALRAFEVGAQNFVLIDTAGRIGWYPHARVPHRPWASFFNGEPMGDGGARALPPWLPLPGDGSAEWDGFVAEADLPKIFDPASGFIATANQPMTDALDDGDPTNDGYPVIQTAAAAGFRQTRIVELIEQLGDEHTPETMHAIQADTYSIPGAILVPALLAAADGVSEELSEATRTLVEALRAWDFTCPTGLTGITPDSARDPDPAVAAASIGCTAFHYAIPKIYQRAFEDELAVAFPNNANPYSHDNLIRPLVLAIQGLPVPFDPDVLWDDLRTEDRVETRDEILVAALAAAATEVRNALGSDPDGWRWGRVHTITFSHELAQAQPSLAHGPFANDGGLFTVDVANPPANARGTRFGHTSGASLRMVNEASAEGIRTWLQLPGGQDLHRDGAFFGNLVEGWLRNEPFELPFGTEAVERAATTSLTVGP